MKAFYYSPVILAIATTIVAGATQEYTVQLDRFATVNLDNYTFNIAIHDDGPKSIRATFNRANPVVFQKRDGFAPEDTETLLYSYGRSRLYYVNIISDHIGFCVLRIKSD